MLAALLLNLPKRIRGPKRYKKLIHDETAVIACFEICFRPEVEEAFAEPVLATAPEVDENEISETEILALLFAIDN